MSELVLAVKKRYFDEIKNAKKTEEYRLFSTYWRKRLIGRDYDTIVITLGYPRRDDASRRIELPWRGCSIKTIKHEHFGDASVEVFAIRLKSGGGE